MLHLGCSFRNAVAACDAAAPALVQDANCPSAGYPALGQFSIDAECQNAG